MKPSINQKIALALINRALYEEYSSWYRLSPPKFNFAFSAPCTSLDFALERVYSLNHPGPPIANIHIK